MTLDIIDKELFNCNYELCKQCGGRCCKRNACDCSPEDFDNDVNKIRLAIQSGNYTIDFTRFAADSFVITLDQVYLDTRRVMTNPYEAFFIRPKNIGRPIVDLIHKTEDEGPCIFWNKDTGCPLKYEKRPKGGRTLVPFLGNNCIAQYDKIQLIADWRPFTGFLIELAKEYFDENWVIYREFNFSIK